MRWRPSPSTASAPRQGLHDLPAPEPEEGEVLVRVRASSVNGFDVSVANGRLKGMIEHRFPVVLGRDFADTVEAAGPGVQSPRPGDIVFGVVTKTALGDGAFGEYVTAPVAYTARGPRRAGPRRGGCAGPGRHGRAGRRRRGGPAAGPDRAHLGRHRGRRRVRRTA